VHIHYAVVQAVQCTHARTHKRIPTLLEHCAVASMILLPFLQVSLQTTTFVAFKSNPLNPLSVHVTTREPSQYVPAVPPRMLSQKSAGSVSCGLAAQVLIPLDNLTHPYVQTVDDLDPDAEHVTKAFPSQVAVPRRLHVVP
jgi:hypothetical protein